MPPVEHAINATAELLRLSVIANACGLVSAAAARDLYQGVLSIHAGIVARYPPGADRLSISGFAAGARAQAIETARTEQARLGGGVLCRSIDADDLGRLRKVAGVWRQGR